MIQKMSNRSLVYYKCLALWPWALWVVIAVVSTFAVFNENTDQSYLGMVKAETVRISAIEDGVIDRLPFSIGDTVTRHDAVVAMDSALIGATYELEMARFHEEEEDRQWKNQLDTVEFELELDKLDLKYAEDRAELDLQRSELERLEKLVAKNLVDRNMYVRVSQKISNLEVSVQKIPGIRKRLVESLDEFKEGIQAQSDVRARTVYWERRLDGLNLKAPTNGVVRSIHFAEGEFVRKGEVVVEIAQSGTSRVVAFLPRFDRSLPSLGESVVVKSNSGLGVESVGSVSRISNGGTILNSSSARSVGPLDASQWFEIELADLGSFELGEAVRVEVVEPETNGLLAWVKSTLGGLL